MEAACADRTTFQAQAHGDRLLQSVQSLREDSRLCDVVIRVGDLEINAHRLVLATYSGFFRAMYTSCSEMIEARRGDVTLREVEATAVKDLIDFMYKSQLELRTDSVQHLLKAACILDIPSVVDACCQFVRAHLHASNCLGIRQFAAAHGCVELQRAADQHMKSNFNELVRGEEFLKMSGEELVGLLSDDDIEVEREEQVVDAAFEWLRHDALDRKQYAPKVLACLRLPFTQPAYLVDKFDNEEIFSDPRCQQLIFDAMKYHAVPERRRLLRWAASAEPRKSTQGTLLVVGGTLSSKGGLSVERYNPRSDSWSVIGEMGTKRLQFGAAVVRGYLYVVGGRDGLKTLKTVERYDPVERSWATVTPMCAHRHGVGVGVLSGPMYAVGGHDGWSYLNSVERFDPETNQWSYVAPMKTARSTVGVAALDNKLYAVGGRDSSTCLKTVECYDPHTNKWTEAAPLKNKRGGLGLTALNNRLYAVGGHDSATIFESVECYDPQTNRWSMVASMSVPRDAVGTVGFGNRLFSLGGYNGQVHLNTGEAYDVEKNEWYPVAGLTVGRAGAGVVWMPTVC